MDFMSFGDYFFEDVVLPNSPDWPQTLGPPASAL
jgi:hypothetical protein